MLGWKVMGAPAAACGWGCSRECSRTRICPFLPPVTHGFILTGASPGTLLRVKEGLKHRGLGHLGSELLLGEGIAWTP